MKKLMLFTAVSMLMLTSCYRVTPNAGEESVLIEQPFMFGDGGVDDTPVSTGSEWVAATTDHKEFNITPQTHTELFENLITQDHINVTFNAYIKIQIRKGQSPLLYKGFSDKWYENSIQETFRTSVRNKASGHNCFELSSDRKILDSLQMAILNEMTAYAKSLNIPIDIQQVLIGSVVPPQAVLDETVLTAAQNQSILTQDARKMAEDARAAAEKSKALADQAYQQQMNMTIDQYLHIRTIEIEKEKVELVKDKQNANISFIFGGGVTPVYPVTK
jgi:regulator of protease activity HflC (stomatin/prohibitin superfamily)